MLSYTEKQNIGRTVREHNTEVVEKKVVDEHHGWTWVDDNDCKADAIDAEGFGVSIKDPRSKSTQVHLTTQKCFIEQFNLNDSAQQFVRLFFGNKEFNKDRNRYILPEIPIDAVNAFRKFLDDSKLSIIEYFLRGDQQAITVNRVMYNDRTMTVQEILSKCESASWFLNRTTVHLKNPDGKTYFHIQMKGSGKSPSTYHSVLAHIHKRMFN